MVSNAFAAGSRSAFVLAGLLVALRPDVAAAQGSAATIEVRLDSTGDATIPVRMQLRSVTDPSQSWSAELTRGESVQFRLVPPGSYRLISGTVEQHLDVTSGDKLTIDVGRPTPPPPGVHEMTVGRIHRTTKRYWPTSTARHQQRSNRSDQRPPGAPARLRPRLPQPHQLHRPIPTRDRRIQTLTTPCIGEEPLFLGVGQRYDGNRQPVILS